MSVGAIGQNLRQSQLVLFIALSLKNSGMPGVASDFGTMVVVTPNRVRILISNTHKRPQLARSLIEKTFTQDAWQLKTVV